VTGAAGLLAEAAALLRGRLAPALSGPPRYDALLAASAVAIAAREIAAQAGQAAADAAIPPEAAAAIREGAHDGDAPLHAALLRAAVLRAWVARPSAVTPAEGAAHLSAVIASHEAHWGVVRAD
jgi:hypothetical protein